MKRLFLTAATVASLICTSAFAADITVFAGVAGGEYDAKARVIATRLEQRNHVVTVENRAGSDDITLQACNAGERIVVWIAQADALYRRELNDGCSLSDVAIYGEEYAMLFFPPDSELDSLSDLTATSRVIIDKVGGGSELTWNTMRDIDRARGGGDDWTHATLLAKGYLRATALARKGEAHAAFMVRKLNSGDIDTLLKQGWTLGYMWDRQLDDEKWNSKPLYEGEKVAIMRDGKRVGRNWAYVVPAFVGTTQAVEWDHPGTMDDITNAAQ